MPVIRRIDDDTTVSSTIYKPAEAAAFVGLGSTDFALKAAQGGLPRFGGPRSVRYAEEDLLAWWQNNWRYPGVLQEAETQIHRPRLRRHDDAQEIVDGPAGRTWKATAEE